MQLHACGQAAWLTPSAAVICVHACIASVAPRVVSLAMSPGCPVFASSMLCNSGQQCNGRKQCVGWDQGIECESAFAAAAVSGCSVPTAGGRAEPLECLVHGEGAMPVSAALMAAALRGKAV